MTLRISIPAPVLAVVLAAVQPCSAQLANALPPPPDVHTLLRPPASYAAGRWPKQLHVSGRKRARDRGSSGGSSGGGGGGFAWPNIYVSNAGTNSITVYDYTACGNVAPIRTIQGTHTGLSGPRGMAFDKYGNLYVANFNGNSITVYPPGANGDVKPIYMTSKGPYQPEGLVIEPSSGSVFVTNYLANNPPYSDPMNSYFSVYAAPFNKNPWTASGFIYNPTNPSTGNYITPYPMYGTVGLAMSQSLGQLNLFFANYLFDAGTGSGMNVEQWQSTNHGYQGFDPHLYDPGHFVVSGLLYQFKWSYGNLAYPWGLAFDQGQGHHLFAANAAGYSSTVQDLNADPNVGVISGQDMVSPAGIDFDTYGYLYAANLWGYSVTEYREQSPYTYGNVADACRIAGNLTGLSVPTWVKVGQFGQ